MMPGQVPEDLVLPYDSPLCDLGKALHLISLSFPMCKRGWNKINGAQPSSEFKVILKSDESYEDVIRSKVLIKINDIHAYPHKTLIFQS